MKAAVALVIALIIPIFHCGACQRASDGEVPRGSLRSKILWGEGAAAERARRWLIISRRKRCTACVFAALRAAGAPAEVCIGKIPRGEGLRPQARFEANRRVSGGSWAEME